MTSDDRWTDEQMRAFAVDRLTEDMHPSEVWTPQQARDRRIAEEVARLEAAGVEVPTDEGARVAPK